MGYVRSDRICAGVVTYRPDIRMLEENLNALVPQVSKVFVIDNGSPNLKEIKTLLCCFDHIKLFCNKENLGISKALNQLCEMAVQDGCQWILTMDQDSVCMPGMVDALSQYTGDPTFGIIAPRVEFWSDGTMILETKDGDKETTEVPACITSGSLTRLSAWQELGGFDEWFFIDMVDNEFCTHLKTCGYRVLRVNKAVIHQHAGKMKYVKLPMMGNVLLPYYDAKRNYSICRNTVYYIRKYRHAIDYRHQFIVFVYSQFIKLLFESGRWSTLRSTFRGIRDGMKKIIEDTN